MNESKQRVWTCRHCDQTFTNAGEWMNHDCDAQPVTVTPAQRDVVAILRNVSDCQVESDGDCLWA